MALAIASGCGGAPPAAPPQKLTTTNFDKIKDGMSLVEIEQFLGGWSEFDPAATVKINGADKRVVQYRWNRNDRQIVVNFVGDKAASKSSKSLQDQSPGEQPK
jgi:hypothetical protein